MIHVEVGHQWDYFKKYCWPVRKIYTLEDIPLKKYFCEVFVYEAMEKWMSANQIQPSQGTPSWKTSAKFLTNGSNTVINVGQWGSYGIQRAYLLKRFLSECLINYLFDIKAFMDIIGNLSSILHHWLLTNAFFIPYLLFLILIEYRIVMKNKSS